MAGAWAQPLLQPAPQPLASNPAGTVQLQLRGPQLQALDGEGHLLREWPVPQGLLPVRVHAARQSFVVVPRGARELWEVSWSETAEPIYDGLVHDYRMGEGLARPGYLGLRRTPLQRPLVAVCGCGDQPWLRVWEEGRGGDKGRDDDGAVLHLDVRRIIARCTAPSTGSGSAPAAAHPGCGCPACPPR
ncbi:MAG: hypothetical protein RJA10_3721 [Pseudomonadota bacterium]